ncbi:MAG: sulfite exporter TauE/SafE family protein, partial [Flavobacteriales bacterium]
LSGFFGGLSGHQGALRSVFLLEQIKDKSVFIATGAMISVANDAMRLTVYSQSFSFSRLPASEALVGILSALLAVIIGTFTLKKVSFEFLQRFVFAGILFLGIAMLIGWV